MTLQYRGLHHLELFCTLIIEASLELNMDILNYEMHVYLDYFISYWMLEMELNLNILQLFFLVYPPYRFEISQNSVKSTVRSEIDQFRSKIGSGL